MAIDTMPNVRYVSGMSKLANLSELLREAIRRDGRSLYKLGIAAGIEHGRLSRFLRHERSLTLPTVEKVCDALGVECQLVRRRTKKGG